MKRILFAWDIDNTLIYSKKHPHDGWKCVEWIHEKEQAYISPYTEELLFRPMRDGVFVPLTSRSVEQYLRICFPEDRAPKYAVTANGADLLIHGKADADWRAETDRMIAPFVPEMESMLEKLSGRECFIRCRAVDQAYVFVYCDPNTDPQAEAENIRRETCLHVEVTGKKIYLLPPILNKGSALLRLKERLGAELTVAAGDSEMDIPMLGEADIAVCLQGSKPDMACGRLFLHSGDMLFSEYALLTAHKILEEKQ